MIERLASGGDLSALKVLASGAEPPKEYDREQLRNYDLYTPLNRMVDAVPAESDAARIFGELATQIASGQGTPADIKQMRLWLTTWRDNDIALQPLLPRSELTAELAPLSRNVRQAAAIGLQALDVIESQQAVSASTQQQWLASLKLLEAPQAVLLNKVVPGVEILVRTIPQR
jgi:hexosaminidase